MPKETDTVDKSSTIGNEILELLLTELPTHLEVMGNQIQSRDYKSLEKSTHKLLGAVVYCDLQTLEENLRNLQQAIIDRDETAIAHNFEYTTHSVAAALELCGR